MKLFQKIMACSLLGLGSLGLFGYGKNLSGLLANQHTQQVGLEQLVNESVVVNIEVPVRVFRRSTFVDTLTINDFEVYEDGKPQKIEAVYLIKKTNIQRGEGEKKFIPQVSRSFVLMFEMKRYLPRVGNAIDEFFEKVATPQDDITFVTPIGSYKIKSNVLETRPRKDIAKELKDRVRSDIIKGSAEYRSLIGSLMDLRDDRSFEEDVKQQMYKTIVEKITNLSCIEENKVLRFADTLKKMPGQKYVFIFYQQEIIPALEQAIAITWENLEEILDRGDMGKKYNPEKVQQAFSDASIMCNFMYITEKSRDTSFSMESVPDEHPNIYMQDMSIGIFNSFKEIAQATGGMTESSGNPASAFSKVLNASENYYLLYYAPKDYQKDGRFREIEVKLKNKDYTVNHRAGYIRD
jgi:VWFA-related protein